MKIHKAQINSNDFIHPMTLETSDEYLIKLINSFLM